MMNTTANGARLDDSTPEVAMIDDYLATRGYPMSAHNRAVVRSKLRVCPADAKRAELFRCLDHAFRRATT